MARLGFLNFSLPPYGETRIRTHFSIELQLFKDLYRLNLWSCDFLPNWYLTNAIPPNDIWLGLISSVVMRLDSLLSSGSMWALREPKTALGSACVQKRLARHPSTVKWFSNNKKLRRSRFENTILRTLSSKSQKFENYLDGMFLRIVGQLADFFSTSFLIVLTD